MLAAKQVQNMFKPQKGQREFEDFFVQEKVEAKLYCQALAPNINPKKTFVDQVMKNVARPLWLIATLQTRPNGGGSCILYFQVLLFCAMTDSFLLWQMIFLGGETEAEWVFERRRLEDCAVALSVISSLHLLLAPTYEKPFWSRHYCQSYHILTMPTTNVDLLTLPWLKCCWNKSSYSFFCFCFAFLCQYQIFTGSGKLSLILPIIMHGVMRGRVKKLSQNLLSGTIAVSGLDWS